MTLVTEDRFVYVKYGEVFELLFAAAVAGTVLLALRRVGQRASSAGPAEARWGPCVLGRRPPRVTVLAPARPAAPSPGRPVPSAASTGPAAVRRRPLVVGAVLAASVVVGALPAIGTSPALAVLAGLVVAATITWFARFDLLLHLLVLSVFVESVGVGPLRVGRLLALTAVGALLARVLLTDWRPRLPRSAAPILPVVVLLVWALASGYWATGTGAWAYAMGQLGLALTYFVSFAVVVERRHQVHQLLRTFVLGAVFASGVAFVQVLGGADRAEGLQGDPNIYALYQVAALPAAALLATSSTRAARWTGRLALPLLLLSVLATSSRGGLATALAVLLIMMVRGDLGHRLRRYRLAATSASVVVAVGALAAVMTLNARFSPERVLSDRASGRFDIWYVAFREWQAHPLLGIGGGGFKPRSVELLETVPGVQLVDSHLLLSTGIEVHNIYLETLVEYGVVGFLLFVSVLLTTGWQLRRAGRESGDTALRCLPMVLVAFLAASFFLSVVNNKLLWMLVGLAVAVSGRPPLRSDGPPTPRRRPAPLTVRVVVLAAAALLTGPAVAAAGVVALPTTWTSSVTFVVSTTASPPDREALVRTLEELAASETLASELVARTGAALTPGELSEQIDVVRPDGALAFAVQIRDRDRQRSAALAAALAERFPARVGELLQEGDDGTAAFFLTAWGGGTVTTAADTRPLLRNVVLGAIGGSALALLLLGAARRPPSRTRRGAEEHVLVAAAPQPVLSSGGPARS